MPRRPAPPAATPLDAGLRAFTGYHLRRAMAVVQAEVNETLAPLGLRMVPFSVLVVIADNPGLRSSQLAEALGMERSNLTPVVEGLVRDGLIARAAADDDRRAHALAATPRGAALAARARAAVAEQDMRLTEQMSPEARAQLVALLDAIETRRAGAG
ncbi:MarR family winged helix-turn-helix transcriptional regulator [Rhodosalinus halophilus]|jgi:DNA-binding MarR family transcriptional regulator|nr:MarR family transcriptional regulator [Rhodosalinus halophilus]